MKRVLLVDDDAVVTKFYRDRLSAHGFQVNTAGDGVAALSILRSGTPDVVVLDLMMPKVSGVDVLQYIRAEPRLTSTPVVLLTNNCNNDLGRRAASMGIEKAFLKAECNPTALMAAIDEILEPRVDVKARVAGFGPAMEAPYAEGSETAARDEIIQAASDDPKPHVDTEDARQKSGEGLLAEAPAICADLNALFEGLVREVQAGLAPQEHLPDLFCRVRFLAEAAGWTGFGRLAQATAVFDALLQALVQHPQRLGAPQLQTVASMVEAVGLLFKQARESQAGTPASARVLIVDDDSVANEMILAALSKAGVNACGIEDAVAAWQWINSEQFDLVVLKLEMPVLTGLQLCERLRKVEGYEKTPVLLVAANDDPENRATSRLTAADDLMAKPIVPQEVAARIVVQLVKTWRMES